MRQAQRLGLEALFGWVERCLIQDDARSTRELVDLTMKAFERDAGENTQNDDYIDNRLAFRSHGGACTDALFAAGREDDRLCIFRGMNGLEEVTRDATTASAMAFKATEF